MFGLGKARKLQITVESVVTGGFAIQVKRSRWSNKKFVAETLKKAEDIVTSEMNKSFAPARMQKRSR